MTRKALPESDLFSLNSPVETVAIVPEIDNLEEEVIGQAILKSFVPGITYFNYQDLLNSRIAKAEDKEAENLAIYDSQVWLLCQIFEVQEPDGKTRPLGLEDIECMEAEELAFRVADIMSVNLTVNFLDEKNDLKDSWFFEIKDTEQRFRVRKLSVQKGVKIQQLSQADPTGVKLTRWLITQRITLNDQPIAESDFNDKLDFATTVILAAKINFLLRTFQHGKTSFYLRSTRAGHSQTSGG